MIRPGLYLWSHLSPGKGWSLVVEWEKHEHVSNKLWYKEDDDVKMAPEMACPDEILRDRGLDGC
jgi:hypothetical protein